MQQEVCCLDGVCVLGGGGTFFPFPPTVMLQSADWKPGLLHQGVPATPQAQQNPNTDLSALAPLLEMPSASVGI